MIRQTPDTDESEPGDGEDLTPGDTKIKDPTVTAVEGDSYTRTVVRILDKDGNVITDEEKLKLILATIRYDSSYKMENGVATTTGLVPGTSYTEKQAEAYPSVNANFTLDDDNSEDGVYYYNYNGKLTEGSTALLFTNIVIPSDWSNDTLETMGNYQIEVYAQAIQAKGFDTADDAFAALDAEIEAGTLQGEPTT